MTSLDTTFTIWQSVRSEHWLNVLLTDVSQAALKWTKDEDAAQEVALVVLDALPTFVPKHETAFTNFVSSTCRRVRKHAQAEAFVNRERYEELTDEVLLEDDTYADLGTCDTFQREVAALILSGHNLNETASAIGTSPAALRKKLERRRHKMSRSRHMEVESKR